MSAAEQFVVAELNTHKYMFKGAGHDRASARAALLAGWTAHRDALLAGFPQLAASIPPAEDLERHFTMVFYEFVAGGGYRDRERLV